MISFFLSSYYIPRSMKKSTILSAVFCLFVLSALAVPPDTLLAGLKKEHPRIIALSADFERVKRSIETDAYMKEAYQRLYEETVAILSAPVCRYEIPDGLRLLATSRKVLDRISRLAFVYRISGEKRFAERAWQELEAAARFPDWNPKHFLDVGEMTYAFALGYDWLFDQWDAARRNVIKSALLEKGLNRAVLAYSGLATSDKSWWVSARHNWNQVCNGGIGVGALAIADEEPALASFLLKNVVDHLPLAMQHFAPDGAWNEGPGYWNYATQYNVAVLAALQSALGRDFGLSQIPGFSKAAYFPVYINGPLDKTFNYADGGDHAVKAPQIYWLAGRFNEPAVARYQHHFNTHTPFDLLWYNAGLVQQKAALPEDYYFRDAEVVTLRSGWNDAQAIFAGLKAGDNKANHSHLDLGSFVLDALGQRWIIDLGAENYNVPGYFDARPSGRRWQYYRTRAEGHNTLVIAPGQQPDQDPAAATTIQQFRSTPVASWAVMDLTAAYTRQAMTVKRGFALLRKKTLLMKDEISNRQPADVYWFAHTPATVTIGSNGRTARLSLNGQQFRARLLSPADARFTLMPAAPMPESPQATENNPNKGIQKLAIHLPQVKQTAITVIWEPDGSQISTGGFERPLEAWGRK